MLTVCFLLKDCKYNKILLQLSSLKTESNTCTVNILTEASPRLRGWTAPGVRSGRSAKGFPAPAGMDPSGEGRGAEQ